MKKLLFLFLMVVACGVSVNARDFTYDDIVYTVLDEKAKTVETKAGYSETIDDKTDYVPGNTASATLFIPETVSDGENEYTVTRLGDYAFCQNDDLLLAFVPETVEEIGQMAFAICTSLYGLTLPESDVKIDEFAFFGCIRLSVIKLPNNLEEISAGMFGVCASLESLDIPSTVTSIGTGAFMGCGLKSVVIPNSVFSIGALAFSSSKLENVTLPSDLIMIGMSAFSGCKTLSEIYYDTKSPAIIFSDTFDENVFKNSTLYVPVGMKKVIESTSTWQNFANVKEMDFSGIETVSVNTNDLPEYFDLNGMRVYAPQPGQILIRRIGNHVEKILMK